MKTAGARVPRITVLLALALLAYQAEAGWQDDEPRADPPSQYPDRIILTWTGDPAISQAVTWRTDAAITKSYAEIAPAEPSADFTSDAERILAVTVPLPAESGTAHSHSAEFTGLQPNTLYVYRVGGGDAWSEWFQFRTASRDPEPFSFLYFGDPQNAILSHFSRTLRAAYAQAPRARFTLFAGDLVSRANHDREWGEWFTAGDWIYATVPCIASPGNHDYGKDEQGVYRLSKYWRPQFSLPENGPSELEETTYYVDYQGLRVISLNSNTRLPEQAEWLEVVLADNPNRWTVVTFHHPIFSSARGRDNSELRDLWKPLFDWYNVDLVLQGHDHSYARGRDLPPDGASKETPGRTVYVVSVSGPKQYELTENRWMMRAAENTQLYQVISVGPDTLSYRAYTTTDELYDAFDVVKTPDGPDKLIDRLKAGTAERTFSEAERQR